ncbi:redoxin domain-containing protein [Bacillus selenatarsenatis]|uniref:Redoxin domain-containing protein n=1 Tax=Mesobacillus selenatarsenatis TaxID=388741 RepID=A0A846TQ87_9BACI|nr:redoxin domain-containing protein [Mesobacillus selenatarsenatis]NKE08034.1 redoxin domain-containing protein [Mesobacillus selenatarsenatis]
MVQLHENLDQLKDLDVNMYIISKDTPEQQRELYEALDEKYGKSLPFISDPDLEMIDHFDMKNGDVAYRGYGLLDEKGTVIFQTVNDHWGEQFDQTVKEIKDEYNSHSK